MAEEHKYWCSRCKRFLIDCSAKKLAMLMNMHNRTEHPADYAQWDDKAVARSANYIGPNSTEKTDQEASTVLEITEKDRAFLAAGRVRWD